MKNLKKNALAPHFGQISNTHVHITLHVKFCSRYIGFTKTISGLALVRASMLSLKTVNSQKGKLGRGGINSEVGVAFQLNAIVRPNERNLTVSRMKTASQRKREVLNKVILPRERH